MIRKPIHYAIYTRQSASDTGKVLSSCDAQFTICRDFVLAQATNRWQWVGERFDDIGSSGATKDRPALQRLLELVNARKIDKVAIYRLDRLSRSLRDSLDILDAFKRASVELLIYATPEIGSAATNSFLLNIMAMFAEFEREIIQSRLNDTRAALKKRGRRLAGKIPYGYDADSLTKQLIINPDEAQRVKAIFQMAADDMLPRHIASKANDQGWRTKRHIAKRSGNVSGGGLWTPRQVLDVLANPVYLGLFADGENTRFGIHEPIISQELFDRAREQVEARRPGGKRNRNKDTMLWPLRGKIPCPNCGRIMSTHTSRRGPVVYRHYRCRSHAGGRPPCKGSGLPAYEIEKCVADMVAESVPAAGLPGLAYESCLLRSFQAVWDMLSFQTQMHLLPEIVAQVIYKESDSTVELHLDIDALERIIKNCDTETDA